MFGLFKKKNIKINVNDIKLDDHGKNLMKYRKKMLVDLENIMNLIYDSSRDKQLSDEAKILFAYETRIILNKFVSQLLDVKGGLYGKEFNKIRKEFDKDYVEDFVDEDRPSYVG